MRCCSALIFCVFGLSGWRLNRMWLLVGSGLVVFAAADSVYLVELAHGTYQYGSWLDLGWPAGFVLIAAGSLASPVRRSRGRLDGMSLVLAPVGMALVCLGIDSWDHFHRVQTVALVAASLGLLAVIGRLMFTFKEYLALLSLTRVESLSDALTGLGNRRALMRHLDDYFGSTERPVVAVAAVRPRRLQVVQRHVRPRRGRRVAPASRGAAP